MRVSGNLSTHLPASSMTGVFKRTVCEKSQNISFTTGIKKTNKKTHLQFVFKGLHCKTLFACQTLGSNKGLGTVGRWSRRWGEREEIKLLVEKGKLGFLTYCDTDTLCHTHCHHTVTFSHTYFHTVSLSHILSLSLLNKARANVNSPLHSH